MIHLLSVNRGLIRFWGEHRETRQIIIWEARWNKGWEFFMDGQPVRAGLRFRRRLWEVIRISRANVTCSGSTT